MANNQIKFSVGYTVDKNSLQQVQQSLQSLASFKISDYLNLNKALNTKQATQDITHLKSVIQDVEAALKSAFNVNLNSLNTTKFNQELSKSNLTIKDIHQTFSNFGAEGQYAFNNLAASIMTTNVQLKQTNNFVEKMTTTLANTIRWSVASSAMNAVVGSVEKAYYYTKDLDRSLNDIRIVTEKSADEMDRFAQKANEAAKGLAASTTDYTNAALIYYQQGMSDAEVQQRAEVTLKVANVTRQSADEVSELLTAVWNGYQVQASEAELYIDKLAAVAAATAADLEELSTGMSKVASAANVAGVDIDQLNAILATVVSVTRQAPESVGTAFKTVFARMSDIEAGLDAETTLGAYTEQMQTIAGISVLDQNNELRDMGDIIEEIGSQWADLSREQQFALAQTMGGARQYNQVLSLFDNWDMYTAALETSANAAGTLQKQQDIYMESTEAHLQQLSTELEDLYDSILDTDTINALVDGLTAIVDKVTMFIDAIGGGKTALLQLGSIATSVLSKQIASGLTTTITNMKNVRYNQELMNNQLENVKVFKDPEYAGNEEVKAVRKEVEDLIKLYPSLTKEEINNYNALIKTTAEAKNLKILTEERLKAATKSANYLLKDSGTKIAQKSFFNKDGDDYLLISERVDEIQNLTEQMNQVSSNAANQILESINDPVRASEEELNTLEQEIRDAEVKLNDANTFVSQMVNLAAKTRKEAAKGVVEIDGETIQIADDFVEEAQAAAVQAKQAVEQARQAYETAKGAPTLKYENTAKQISELYKTVQQYSQETGVKVSENLQKAFNIVGADGDLESIRLKIDQIVSSPNGTQALKSSIQDIVKEMGGFGRQGQAVLENLRLSLGMTEEEFNALIGKAEELEGNLKNTLDTVSIQGVVQGVTQLVGLAGQLVSIVQTLSNISKILNDETLSQGEKATQVITALVSVFISLGSIVPQLKNSISVLAGAIGTTVATVGIWVGVIAGAAVAIAGIIHLVDKFTVTAKEAREELEKATEAYNEQIEKLNELEDKIKTTTDRLEELYDLANERDLSIAEEEELQNLEQENIKLAAQLELQKQLAELKKQDRIDAAVQAAQKDSYNYANVEKDYYSFQDATNPINKVRINLNDEQQVKEYLKNAEELVASYESYISGDEDAFAKYGKLEQTFKFSAERNASNTFSQLQRDIETIVNLYNAEDGPAQQILEYTQTAYEAAMSELPLLYELKNPTAEQKKSIDYYENLSFDYLSRFNQLDNVANTIFESQEQYDKFINEYISAARDSNRQGLTVEEYKALLGDEGYQKLLDILKIQGLDIDQYLYGLSQIEVVIEETGDDAETAAQKIQAMTSAFNSLIEKAQKGSVNSENILDDEDYKEILSSLNAIISANKELSEEAFIFQTTALAGTEVWTEALYKLKDAQSELRIDGLKQSLQEQETALTEFLRKYAEGKVTVNLSAALEDGEFKKQLQEILNTKYQIVIEIATSVDQTYTKGRSDIERLEQAIESINEDYTIDSEDIYELESLMPGITRNRGIREDGAIQLDQAIVDAAIEQAKTALQASTDSKVSDIATNISKLKAEAIALNEIVNNPNLLLEGVLSEADSIDEFRGALLAKDDINKFGDIKDWIQNSNAIESIWEKISVGVDPGEAVQEIFGSFLDAVYEQIDDAAAKLLALQIGFNPDSLYIGSNKKQKELDQLEDEADAYYEINLQLEEYSHQLSLLEKQQDKLFGKNLIDNLKQELNLIKQQNTAYQEKYNIAANEQELIKGKFEELYTEESPRLQFENGLITQESYEAVFEHLLSQVNTAANNGDEDAYEAAEKNFERFQDLLSQYDDATSIMQETTEAIQDGLNEIIENQIEQFGMEIEIRLDMKEAYQQMEDFKRDLNNFELEYTSANAADLLFKGGVFNGDTSNFDNALQSGFKAEANNITAAINKYSGLTSWGGTIQENTEYLNHLMDQLYQYNTEGWASAYGDDISQLLEDSEAALTNQQELLLEAEELAQSVEDSYINLIDEAISAMDDHIKQYEYLNDLYGHDMNVIGLLYGDDAYDQMSKYYDAIEENNNTQIEALKNWSNYAKTMMENSTDDDIRKKWQDEWEDSLSELNKKVEDSIQNIIDSYKNSINQVFNNLNTQLTNGKGLSYISEEWELLNKKSEMYLDTVNSTYEIQKLENKYLEAINDMDSTSAQKKLNSLMEDQLEMLREKDKLSEYEVERANALYEIALKEIALEEAQRNKSSMRLRRDAQGNYSFQYVTDEDAISKAQQELLEAQNDLYNIDKDAYQDNLDEVYKLYEEWNEKVKEVYLDNTLSAEERNNKILLYEQQYGEMINALTQDNENIRVNLMDSAITSLGTMYLTNQDNFQNMTESQKQMMEEVMQHYQDDLSVFTTSENDRLLMVLDNLAIELTEFERMNEAQREEYERTMDSFTLGLNDLMSYMIPTWDSGVQSLISKLREFEVESETEIGLVKLQFTGFRDLASQIYGELDTLMSDYSTSLTTLETVSGEKFTDMATDINDVKDSMTDAVTESGLLVNAYQSQIDKIAGEGGLISSLSKLVTEYGLVKDAAVAAAEAIYAEIEAKQKEAAVTAESNSTETFPGTNSDYTIDYGDKPSDDSAETQTSGSSSQASGSTTSTTSAGDGIPSVGDKVTLVKGPYYYDSFGTTPTGSFHLGEEGAFTISQVVSNPRRDWGQTKYIHLQYKGQNYGWVDKDQISGYNTGGYTGSWGNEGKLGILHQKELVLNAQDTENILSAVNIVRNIESMINALNQSAFSHAAALAPSSVSLGGFARESSAIDQNVHIEASFPGVRDSKEIEEAFNNLVNIASMHAFNNQR